MSKDFQLVVGRGKRKNHAKINRKLNETIEAFGNLLVDPDIDFEQVYRKTAAVAEELKDSSSFDDDFCKTLHRVSKALDTDKINKIVCYGLGNFSASVTSRHQLGLLINLQAHCNCPVAVYDPVFTEREKEVLRRFDFEVFESNEEGKRKFKDVTLVYMPHCTKQLTNNLLFANWSPELYKCILLCNSVSDIISLTPSWNLKSFATYILKIQPYISEVPVINSFENKEAFSSTSFHYFLKTNLVKVPDRFWDDRLEPKYAEDDLEFINASMKNS